MRIDRSYSSRQRYDQNRISHNRPSRRRAPVAMTILADVAAAALLLLFFYVTNYVISPDVVGTPLSTPSSAPGASAALPTAASTATSAEQSAENTGNGQSPAPTGTEQATAAPASTSPAEPATLREKFADKFTAGEVVKTDASYKSANVNVSINKVQENGVTYFVADIYVADIKYFRTAFGSTNKLGTREFVDDTLKANGGIIGINGDNCLDNPCLLIRNGIYYPKFTKTSSDALVMYNDGTMKTIPGGQFSMSQVKAESPYQVWGFGPMLLDNGKPLTKFNSPIRGTNPRTSIGYYEPGHYCFVVVDGRQPGYSNGYTLADLSQLFYKLGCKAAYNFDGGGTTQMAFMGNRINSPCSDYRKTYDMIYIADN